jgi:hypothetical protein
VPKNSATFEINSAQALDGVRVDATALAVRDLPEDQFEQN